MNKVFSASGIAISALLLSAAFSSHASQLPQSLRGLSNPDITTAYIASKPDLREMKFETGKVPGTPYRYGIAVETPAISLKRGRASQGEMVSLANGDQAWRLLLVSPAAKSLDFEFSTLKLPAGAQLFLSNADKSVIRGPITSADLSSTRYFSAYVPGDTVVMELVASKRAMQKVELTLASVTHAYRGLFEENTAQKSGSCNVDTICSQGDAWRDQIDSVGHYTFRQGTSSYVCTGTLTANATLSTTPYFLTANHCVSTETVADTIVVYWNYQSSTCRTPGSTSSGTSLNRSIATHSQSGTALVATNAASDFALLRLDLNVPTAANPYWSGWDRRDLVPTTGTGIHHPSGHEKRIAHEYQPLSISAYSQTAGGDTHLRIADWDDGTTEGGSSGSGLWNQDKRLVGQLHGGSAACGNNLPDWYGRLFKSWTGANSNSTRLSNWLDPSNSGVQTVNGYRSGGTPPPSTSFFENLTDYTISDFATIESPLSVVRTGNASATLKVAVTIYHTYKGDLKVDLIAPNGTVYVLHNRSGGSADNIIATFTVNASAVAANGTWKLRVNDNAAGDVGWLDKWSLQF